MLMYLNVYAVFLTLLKETQSLLAGKLFIIRPWTREVELSRGMIKSVPVRVKMSKVPKDFWNPKGFSFLGSAIGKPLFMDKTTEKSSMLTFARICVEVEPMKELPKSIPLGPDQTVELNYPWKPLLCAICSVFGRSSSQCTPPPKLNNNNTAWQTNPTTNITINNTSWNSPKKPIKPALQPTPPIPNNSILKVHLCFPQINSLP
ncbi:hypothetical protein FRX31_002109 [Thalictrum thalictroides]|uniref:DUF4283 domain-containing protein n=1 Tax=Thalictrum thalictroides TaxID=46969 RepID=A0A7J6XHL4_THATH|nr:hypothetical protein FRX31_002109 [Thalictrum thalictroides]